MSDGLGLVLVRQVLSSFLSLPPSSEEDRGMKSRGRTELEAEDVKTWLHLTPSLSEDHPLPSPSDCAQLLSLHPVIQLLYPPPDCTQHTQNLTFVSLGYCSSLALLWVWTICAVKASLEKNNRFLSSAAEEGQSDLRISRSIFRFLSIPAWSSWGEHRGPDGALKSSRFKAFYQRADIPSCIELCAAFWGIKP